MSGKQSRRMRRIEEEVAQIKKEQLLQADIITMMTTIIIGKSDDNAAHLITEKHRAQRAARKAELRARKWATVAACTVAVCVALIVMLA